MTRTIGLTEAQAIQKSSDNFDLHKGKRQSDGYTIDGDGFIVGKNASTGLDATDKQRTTSWGYLENEDTTFEVDDVDLTGYVTFEGKIVTHEGNRVSNSEGV